MPDTGQKSLVRPNLAAPCQALSEAPAATMPDAAATETESVVARVTEIVAVAVDLAHSESDNGNTNGLVATLIEVAEKVITRTDSKP